ncbi:MAG: hypothetical protein [Cressdnaviricota sp.]|nr:MAG: hypothetical protein [Cressdnaviricota sp.]
MRTRTRWIRLSDTRQRLLMLQSRSRLLSTNSGKLKILCTQIPDYQGLLVGINIRLILYPMGMAKRKYSSKSKIEPAAQTFAFGFSLDPTTSVTKYIDLSQVASIVNRRFYRQGINWAVAGFKVFNVGGTTGDVTLSKLPNTWVMSNSWEKSMRTWNKMNREALAESPSVRPKFLDFKIYADAEHHQAGFAANLLPTTATSVGTAGEWEPSKIYIPNALNTAPATTQDFEMIATGASFGPIGASGLSAVSCIEGYAASRGLPDVLDPNTPSDVVDTGGSTPENWMAALFNDGLVQTSEVLDDMVSENNIAPYPFENDGVHTDTMYPGGANQLTGLQLHDVEYFTATTISNTVRLKGGNFPCGLMRLDVRNTQAAPGQYAILIDLVPGNHRGYLCEPMTEM